MSALGEARQGKMKQSCILAALLCVATGEALAQATGLIHLPIDDSINRNGRSSRVRLLSSPLHGAAASTLPSRWDSREHGWVTPVRNQGRFGTCWAFAAIGTLETQLLKSGRGEYDLSERHLANLSGFETPPTVGGNYNMAAAYFMRCGGAVAESLEPYPADVWTESVDREPSIRVKELVLIPPRESTNDNDTLKTAIMQYGAVHTGMYMSSSCLCSNGAYLSPSVRYSDHAVLVVGWDDDYADSNFTGSRQPKGDGAWLVKNSWGVSSGDKGYMHVSYYDPNFAIYDNGVVFIPFDEGEECQGVYGYDRCGYVGSLRTAEPYEAAVFTAAADEELTAVGIFTLNESTPYKIDVYTNYIHHSENMHSLSIPFSPKATAAFSQSGIASHAGNVFIELERPVSLKAGYEFCIVYQQTGDDIDHYVTFDSDVITNGLTGATIPYSRCEYQEGATYVGSVTSSSRTGDDSSISWTDLYSYEDKCALCLKAYTKTPTVKKPEPGAKVAEALAAFKTSNPLLYLQYGSSYGAFSNLAAPNGCSLAWNWIVGGEFFKEETDDFTVYITTTNSLPYIDYFPKRDDRVYTIYGSTDLSSWSAVSDPASSGMSFFKVGIGEE